ncbi:MAG: MBL fold metallo-hydrolase [Lachnospiraceae bacterium]
MNFRVEQNMVGEIATNCYFLVNTDTMETIIIDPGAQADFLSRKIEEHGLKPVVILLTHGHFDHVMGAEALQKKYQIKLYVHEDDLETLQDPRKNVSPMLGKPLAFHADGTFREGDVLEYAGFCLEVLHTPGHTPGGACFYAKEQQILFTGDSLFQESIGRTDFPGGSASSLIRSVQEKVLTLPGQTVVYTGHGANTTVGAEKAYNPYF